ncbi:hypothetical protein KKA95_00175 [Patescibacteria group bacterium]|nr:hypothetical protein [Patescibacteria group bacterium]
MKNYFEKFTDLQPRGNLQLSVVPTRKLTALLSYQQPHFNLITDPQELIVYRKLTHRIKPLESEIEKIERRCKKIVEQHPQVKEMTSGLHNLMYERFSQAAKGISSDEKKAEYQQATQDLIELRREVYSEAMTKPLREQQLSLLDQIEDLRSLRDDREFKTMVDSPADHLLIYDVFDYAGEPVDRPIEEQDIEPCFQFLQNRLLDDLRGHDNDEIERIVMDVGPHDWIAEIGVEIQDERGLEHGIVQVYSSVDNNPHPDVKTIVKSEQEVCDEIKKWGLPREVVEVFKWPGEPIEDFIMRMFG